MRTRKWRWAVAGWVLALGGFCAAAELTIPAGADDAAFERLMAGRTDWTVIRCRSAGLSDAWLAKIARCENLKHFENELAARLATESFAAFAACPRLTSLELALAPGTGKGLAQTLSEACPNLRVLWVTGANFGDIDLAYLAGLEQLVTLGLLSATSVTDEGIGYLAPLQQLRTLYLDAAPDLTDAAFAHMAELRRLCDIRFFAVTQVTDQTLLELAKLPDPNWIHFTAATAFTDKGVLALAKTGRVRGIILSVSPEITDESVVALGKHNPRIVNVVFSASREFTDASLKALDACTNLQNVVFPSAEKISAEAAARFRARHPKTTLSLPAAPAPQAAPTPEEDEVF